MGMNAPISALVPTEPAVFASALRAVNAWRGRCMANFAAVEARVTETLVALAATDTEITLPHLVGQRCGALALALVRKGEQAVGAADAMTAWQAHDTLRAFLCHGVAKVTLARDETWQVVFDLAALRSRKLHRSFLVVDEAEAEAIVRCLHRDRQRLEVRLKPYSERLPSTTGPVALRIGNLP